MNASGDIPVPCRIVALMQEQNRLFAYPLERLASEIRATRFRCDCCGVCCSRAVNGHVFLLDHEMAGIKKIDPAAYEPAPDPEFCDQNGMLYVSGYAVRTQKDKAGSCWFLDNGKCRIYDNRFSGCRIYPHMLRRSVGPTGEVTWHRFARENGHGRYDPALSLEECVALAREIKEYENAYLTQQISFLETIHEYFSVYTLRHDPAALKRNMLRFTRGRAVDIKVFDAGELVEYRIARMD